MMKDSVKTDVTTVKVTVIEVISGVIGIAMIALGYYMDDRNVWQRSKH